LVWAPTRLVGASNDRCSLVRAVGWRGQFSRSIPRPAGRCFAGRAPAGRAFESRPARLRARAFDRPTSVSPFQLTPSGGRPSPGSRRCCRRADVVAGGPGRPLRVRELDVSMAVARVVRLAGRGADRALCSQKGVASLVAPPLWPVRPLDAGSFTRTSCWRPFGGFQDLGTTRTFGHRTCLPALRPSALRLPAPATAFVGQTLWSVANPTAVTGPLVRKLCASESVTAAWRRPAALGRRPGPCMDGRSHPPY